MPELELKYDAEVELTKKGAFDIELSEDHPLVIKKEIGNQDSPEKREDTTIHGKITVKWTVVKTAKAVTCEADSNAKAAVAAALVESAMQGTPRQEASEEIQ